MRLDKNENILKLPVSIVGKLRKELTADFLSSYPEVDALYAKLARSLKCGRENLYLSSGSDGAIKSVFEAFVEKGDKVLLVSPTYAMFYVYAGLFQARLLEIQYDDQLRLPVQNVIESIRNERPKLVCIANPNSPTGTVIPQARLKDIIAESEHAGAVILIDEAYHWFYNRTAAGWIRTFPSLVVTRTFSKAFGLASARLGYAIGHADMIQCLHKTRPMYETNAFALKFAEILLDHRDILQKNIGELLKGKAYLEEQLKKMNIPFFKSHANFLLIDVGSPGKAKYIAAQMKKAGILIKGGFDNTPIHRCIRINLGSPAQMKIFLKHFKDILS